jgi:2-hydroxychromene-2-carboxylate isomerase
MSETIKFYYDYKSPFTYLAFAPACALEKSHDITLRFVPQELDVRSAYGGDLEQRPDRDWFKVRYLYADVRRFANERGLTIRGPQKIFDSRLALMSGLYAERHGRFREYSGLVFERFFKRELDLENVDALGTVLAEVGLELDDFRRWAEIKGQESLSAARAEADRDGVFGVPTLIVAGEMFWGNDRIEWVAKKLDAMGLRRPDQVQN